MSLLRKLLGLSEPRESRRFIPASDWAGHFASLIAAQIARSGLTDLREMAAFINKSDNRPGLCGDRDSRLPDMTDDPDVLVYCYVKDVSTFTKNAATIERLLQLSANSAQILAKYTKDTSIINQPDESILQSPMVDQIAFSIALDLEEKVRQLYSSNA